MEPMVTEATADGPAESADIEASRPARSSRQLGLNPGLLVGMLYAGAALPVLLMLRRVHSAASMQYADYWTTLIRITNPDGSLRLRGLFSYQNEHPFFVPNLLYYLDARLLSGNNRELGYYSILMALVSAALLWRFLPKVWSATTRAAMFVAITGMLFIPSGAWNFVRGMSGTAWLTANVFALLAILLAWRGRTIPATVLAGVAIASYGTGFAAPIAVTAIALWRREKPWRIALPAGVLVVALGIYKLTANGGSSGKPSHDLGLFTSTFLSNLGMLWDSTGSTSSLLIGGGGILLVVMGVSSALNRRAEFADLTPWFGVATYAVFASLLISYGRSESADGVGASSRYASLSALFWLAVLVISVRVLLARREVAVRIGVVALAVAVCWAASPSLLASAVAQQPAQNAVAAAVAVNATDGAIGQIYLPQQQIPRLKALKDYPFDGSFKLGCGSLKPGDSIDPKSVQRYPASAFPTYGAINIDVVTGSTRRVAGWLYRLGSPMQCVFLINSSGTIVGAGAPGITRPDVAAGFPGYPGDLGFESYVPTSAGAATLIIGFQDGFWRLPAEARGKVPTS
jgi:hypothetical protein